MRHLFLSQINKHGCFASQELDPNCSQLLYCVAAANHHMTSRETIDIVFLSVLTFVVNL